MPIRVRQGGFSTVIVIAALVGCSGKHSANGAAGTDPFHNGGGAGAPTDDTKDDFANAPAAGNSGASGGSGDPAAGGQDPSGGSPQGSILPTFPGSGTSNAGDPLPNGMLCDAVEGAGSPIPERIEQCYFDKNDPAATDPAATLEQVLECVADTSTVHIRLTFHPWFVDNTYGDNSVGWHVPKPDANGKLRGPSKGGHSFNDLVESDHAEITFTDANGAKVMQFKLDYLSADPSRPSGYGSLGVLGGEGSMILGDAADVVRWSTSEDLNLNDRGYASYTSESPATDMDYTPNPDAPEWDYRVVYEAWIDIDAFGAAGFGGAEISYVHASPSKADSNTVEVKPGDCPCNDPDGCHKNPPPPPPTDKCGSNDPDNVCGDAGLIDSGTPTGGTPVPEMVM
jgi:hypothetical protein